MPHQSYHQETSNQVSLALVLVSRVANVPTLGTTSDKSPPAAGSVIDKYIFVHMSLKYRSNW